METINISEYTNDSFIRTMVLAVQSTIFLNNIERSKIVSFIQNYIPECEELLLTKNICDSNNQTILKDIRIESESVNKNIEYLSNYFKTFPERDSFKTKELYNKARDEFLRIEKMIREKSEYNYLFSDQWLSLINILIMIDECNLLDDEIIDLSSLHEYKSLNYKLQRKSEALIFINGNLTKFIINEAQKRNDFYGSGHYSILSNIFSDMKTTVRFQSVNAINPLQQLNNIYAVDVLLIIDLYKIKKQCAIVKLLVALLFMIMSPEYDKVIVEYAYNLITYFSNLLYCGNIHKIFLQNGIYNRNKQISDISSKDYPTRISIIFSTRNQDFFVCRIDLSHKGKESFHINLEEVIGDRIVPTGYPIDIWDFNSKVCLTENEFNSLFFVLNDMVWFKSNFVHILNHIEMNIEKKNILKNLFNEQSHLEIKLNDYIDKCNKSYDFTEELKKYIDRFNIKENVSMYYDKENIDYAKEIKKYRSLFDFENSVINYSFNYEKRVILYNEIKEWHNLLINYVDINLEYENDNRVEYLYELWEKMNKYMDN